MKISFKLARKKLKRLFHELGVEPTEVILTLAGPVGPKDKDLLVVSMSHGDVGLVTAAHVTTLARFSQQHNVDAMFVVQKYMEAMGGALIMSKNPLEFQKGPGGEAS